jgi:hypothetical protein
MTEKGKANQRHLELPEGLSKCFIYKETYWKGSFATVVENVRTPDGDGVLKVYGNKYEAAAHCWTQVYLYRMGLAAPVFETIRYHPIPSVDNTKDGLVKKRWGYISARCRVLVDDDKVRRWQWETPVRGEEKPPAYYLRYYLRRVRFLLAKVGMTWNDDKLDNMGVYDNKLLIIDAGCMRECNTEGYWPDARECKKMIRNRDSIHGHPRNYTHKRITTPVKPRPIQTIKKKSPMPIKHWAMPMRTSSDMVAGFEDFCKRCSD